MTNLGQAELLALATALRNIVEAEETVEATQLAERINTTLSEAWLELDPEVSQMAASMRDDFASMLRPVLKSY